MKPTNDLKNEGATEKRKADCAIMLQKIQDKGPILKRDLFRRYDVQTRPFLGQFSRT